jgi:hypothetical protein
MVILIIRTTTFKICFSLVGVINLKKFTILEFPKSTFLSILSSLFCNHLKNFLRRKKNIKSPRIANPKYTYFITIKFNNQLIHICKSSFFQINYLFYRKCYNFESSRNHLDSCCNFCYVS